MTKKNNKYILEPAEEAELKLLIKSGYSVTEIKAVNTFNLRSEKAIKRFACLWKISEALYINNKKYKSEALRSSHAKKASIKIKNIDEYKNKISSMVCEENATINDLIKSLQKSNFRIGVKTLRKYLEKTLLYDQCIKNAKKKISAIAKINGRKSAKILRGVELKPITPEISMRYLELKNSGMYKTKVYDVIKSEFGFKYKKIKQLCEIYGYPEENPQTGELNSMYGKSPSVKSGVGVKCWIVDSGKKIFCRSSLELFVYLFLLDAGITFDISKHRIKYKNEKGVERTYNPDIVIDDCVYEIKPEKLVNTEENRLKFSVLTEYCKKFCLKCAIITEKTYDINKYKNLLYIDNLIKADKLIIDDKNLTKLKKYIKNYD